MGSKRLERIQTIIEELVEAKKSGAEEQVVAALQALSAPLPPEVKLEQGPQVRAEQTLRHAGVLRRIEEVGHGAEGITAAFTAVNIILGEQLGIEPPAVDQALETGLGLAGQAQNLFIDPETGIAIRGEKVGELKPQKSGISVISALATAEKPLGQNELTTAAFGIKINKPPSQARAIVSKINTWAAGADLPPVVERGDEGGYTLAAAYQVLGIERALESSQVSEKPQPAVAGLEVLTISQVLEQPGIKGKMTDVRLRHLANELVASGHLKVGEHVVQRYQGDKAYLDYTPEGIAVLTEIAEQFGSQGKVYAKTVQEWLEAQKSVVAKPTDEISEKVYWGSQIAKKAGIPVSALTVLREIGVFQEDTHFRKVERGGRALTIFTEDALSSAIKVGKFAKAKGQARFTERLIRDAIGLPPEVEPDEPYGPNGPRTFTVFEEHAILQRLQMCIPTIEQRTGQPLQDNFKQELATRLGELTARFTDDDELTIEPKETLAIRRRAAAAVLELSQDARPFNFLRSQHPGIEIGLAFIRGVRKAGQKEMIREFAEAIVNPPTKIPDPMTIARDGLVGKTLSVGPMGTKNNHA